MTHVSNPPRLMVHPRAQISAKLNADPPYSTSFHPVNNIHPLSPKREEGGTQCGPQTVAALSACCSLMKSLLATKTKSLSMKEEEMQETGVRLTWGWRKIWMKDLKADYHL